MPKQRNGHGRPLKGLRRASPSFGPSLSRKRFEIGQPISRIDIRVLPILLTFLCAVVASYLKLPAHSMDFDLYPLGDTQGNPFNIRTVKNTFTPEDAFYNVITITERDGILWNCEEISQSELVKSLNVILHFDQEPETIFLPEANAGYGTTARVLQIIKASGVTKFRFAGLEQHRHFETERRAIGETSVLLSMDLVLPDPIELPERAGLSRSEVTSSSGEYLSCGNDGTFNPD